MTKRDHSRQCVVEHPQQDVGIDQGARHVRPLASLALQRGEAGGLDVIYLNLGQSTYQCAEWLGPVLCSIGTAAVNLDIRIDLEIAGIVR
jgi:hypothetical protein